MIIAVVRIEIVPFELLRVIFITQVAGDVVGVFVGEVISEAELAVALSSRCAIFHRAVVRGEGVRQFVGEAEIDGDGLQVFVLIADRNAAEVVISEALSGAIRA